jgi:hypothetical protein
VRVGERDAGSRDAVQALLSTADESAPRFWETGEEIWVRTGGAELRVIHCPRAGTGTGPQPRPIVLVPGFGVIPEGFQEFYRAVHGKAEFFYIETREKGSARLLPGADMSMGRMAKDLAELLAAVGLGPGTDYVMAATCWGATIALEGLLAGTLRLPTLLACDPMHALYFPRWVLRWVSPVLPVGVVKALRPAIYSAMLGDMKEPVQKQRTRDFVYGADVGKWKRAAEAARDVELVGRMGGVSQEVLVLNGTADKVHDPALYPLLAAELPRGRFLFMPADESARERLFGTAAVELSTVSSPEGLPPSLAPFEQDLAPLRRRTPV